ncbi:MAG: hypothetical protein GY862_05910 [Gammaproteobacteria bacterium]|nr:hypothetical protein [Gammaproteobacteria bacterium]
MSEINELKKDEQDWLDILAGKRAADADADTAREAAALRLGILNKENVTPANQEERLQKILARVHENAGEKPRRPRENFWKKMLNGVSRLQWEKPAVAVASVLFILTAAMWHDMQTEEQVTPRYAPKITVRLIEAEPEKKAWLLQYALRELDAEAYVGHDKTEGNVWEVYIPLAEEPRQAEKLNDFLKENEFSVKPGFGLLIKIADLHVNRVYYPEPEERALELQQAFMQTGAQVELTKPDPAVWRLDIQLPALPQTGPEAEALADVMADNHFIESLDGHIRIEIEPE